MLFDNNVEHKIGLDRCFALFRDQARKHKYYGANVELLQNSIVYNRKEGRISLVIEEKFVHLHMELVPEYAGKKDELNDLFLKPALELPSNKFDVLPYKIFGTGLSRTGTTSLCQALNNLNIFNIHHAPYMYQGFMDGDMCLKSVPEYDAFIDTPFSYFYRQLDEVYPGSKFIHTTRDAEEWATSMQWLLGNNITPAGRWFYGTGQFDRKVYIDKFRQHEKNIRQYFKGRSEDFLVIKLGAKNNWSRICGFLGKPVPNIEYPNLNKKSGSQSPLTNTKIAS